MRCLLRVHVYRNILAVRAPGADVWSYPSPAAISIFDFVKLLFGVLPLTEVCKKSIMSTNPFYCCAPFRLSWLNRPVPLLLEKESHSRGMKAIQMNS